jgi:hypothetical protein
MQNIINFYSHTGKTKFSADYNYCICEGNIADRVSIQTIKDIMLSKEQEILSYPLNHYDSGGTNLRLDSTTSRFDSYNIFKWDDILEIKKLKNAIKEDHDNFIECLGYPKEENIYGQMWVNIMKSGDQMAIHSHGKNHYSYLGAHICIEANNTNTYYYDPYYDTCYTSKNEIGKITFFPSWLKHGTDMVKDNDIRITLAMDLYTEDGYKDDIYDDKKYHWEKF